MRTRFTAAQLADPQIAASQAAIRKCVHCGFCTATCPTYVLLGDERDSPRGRIELIQAMLQDGGPPAPSTVTHVDRCLSCLACTTTCPSGVDYAQLIDHARAHIEATHVRPWPERWLRRGLAWVLPYRRRFAVALALGRMARPLAATFERLGLAPLAAMLRLANGKPSPPCGERVGSGGVRSDSDCDPVSPGSVNHLPPRSHPHPNPSPQGGGAKRVILLQGCIEPVLAPQIREAAIRLITRAGYEVILAPNEGCCGALSEHLGRAAEAKAMARANVAAWAAVGEVAAVVTTAAGCGTAIKGYGKLLGASASPPARDILEFIAEVGLPPVVRPVNLAVAYHAACSLQHGQQIKSAPARLLAEAGFEVRSVTEGHLCCGSAGVYNILQPELATQLRDRKAANIAATGAKVVAAGNIGCIAQLAPVLDAAVIHPVQLLDWATGGPVPVGMHVPSA